MGSHLSKKWKRIRRKIRTSKKYAERRRHLKRKEHWKRVKKNNFEKVRENNEADNLEY